MKKLTPKPVKKATIKKAVKQNPKPKKKLIAGAIVARVEAMICDRPRLPCRSL